MATEPRDAEAFINQGGENGHEHAAAAGSATVRSNPERSAATANIDELAESAAFRKHLLYRFAKARITLPPLRDDPEDSRPICRCLLRE